MSTHPHHQFLSLSHSAVNHAEGVQANIRKNDFTMARGHASLLLGQTKELLRWLEEQVEQLPEPAWLTDPANPYDNIYLSGPTTEDGLQRLSEERLLEYCRATNWSRTLRGDVALVVVEGDVPCAARASSTWSRSPVVARRDGGRSEHRQHPAANRPPQ